MSHILKHCRRRLCVRKADKNTKNLRTYEKIVRKIVRKSGSWRTYASGAKNTISCVRKFLAYANSYVRKR